MTKTKQQLLADRLRREIERGEHAPGESLPSERALEAETGFSRNTVQAALSKLKEEGLVQSGQGKGYFVRPQFDPFVLNASRFENLQFPQDGDAYSTDVKHAGRTPRQVIRVEMLPTPSDIAGRLRVETDETSVLRFCHRFVDDEPWSTQATYYPKWLADRAPRLSEPQDVEEGTTAYLASVGIEQVGFYDEIKTRMPRPEEARRLGIGTGVPVMIWTRTGYAAERPVRCTETTLRGDLSHMAYEIKDLSARGENETE
jgi:GntR family transcriptional regulator